MTTTIVLGTETHRVCSGCASEILENGEAVADAVADRATWMIRCAECHVWYCEDDDDAPRWDAYVGCRVYGNDDHAAASCDDCRPACGCPDCDPDHYRDLALDR